MGFDAVLIADERIREKIGFSQGRIHRSGNRRCREFTDEFQLPVIGFINKQRTSFRSLDTPLKNPFL